jgi:hypothetical protein
MDLRVLFGTGRWIPGLAISEILLLLGARSFKSDMRIES